MCLGQTCATPYLFLPEKSPTDLQVLGYHPDSPVDDDADALADQDNETFLGDKSEWIRNASDQILTNCPRIDAFMWFNMDKERDWRVDSSPGSLVAFRESWSGLHQGVFLEGFSASTAPHDAMIDAYESLVQKSQTRIGWYESLNNPFPSATIDVVQNRGAIPYIVWEPYDGSVFGESAYAGRSRLGDIAAGRYDEQINTWARAAAADGRAIEITFGHEMNSDWYTWGYIKGHNGNTPQLYVAAFRHVHDLFDAAGADNVSFVWTINSTWRDDFSVAFPGEQYVDRLGINGHNWGGDPNAAGPAWSKWRPFERIFGSWDPYNPAGVNNYEALAALADLPIIIGEFASAGGDPTEP